MVGIILLYLLTNLLYMRLAARCSGAYPNRLKMMSGSKATDTSQLEPLRRTRAALSRCLPSWYSSAETHIFLNVLSPARMDPPIQVLYLRSGGALMRILVSRSASFFTSCSNRSPNPAAHEEDCASAQMNDKMQSYRDWLTLDESPSSAEHDVAEQAFTQVEVCAVDRVDHDLVHARVFESDELGREKQLGGAVSLGAEPDQVAVWQAEVFAPCAALRLLLLLRRRERDITCLLLCKRVHEQEISQSGVRLTREWISD